MSGKAVSRASHGHLLVESTLVNKLVLAITPHKRIGSELEERTDTSDDTNVSTDSEALCNKMHGSETLPGGDETTDLDIAITTERYSDDQLCIAEVEKIGSLFEGVSNKLYIPIRISFVYASDKLLKLEKLINRTC